jgi:hypothetical protein
MSDDTTREGTFASVDTAVAEKERLAALSGGRLWRVAGPFLTLNEPIDFANRPPAAQAGEFSVVFAANAFFAIWLQ